MGHLKETLCEDSQAPTGSEMKRAGVGVSKKNEEILGK